MGLISGRSTRGAPAAPRMKRPSERKSRSRTATRALDVLECFADEGRPLRAIEIAHKLALAPSTTNQLLKTMVDSAHLLFNAQSKTYFPSPRISGLAKLLTDAYGVDQSLQSLVRDVWAKTKLSVTLNTPNDLFMQILYILAPPEQTTERGLKVEVFGAAIGSAFLSTLSDTEFRAYARRAGIKSALVPPLLAVARQVRRDGYADGISAGGDYWTIGMALPQKQFPAPLVLGVSGPRQNVEPRSAALCEVMRRAIERWI